MHFNAMDWAVRVKGHAPLLPKIRDRIRREALRAELLPKRHSLHPLAFDRQDPTKLPYGLASWIEAGAIDRQGRMKDIPITDPGVLTERLDQPRGCISIDVPVPGRLSVAEQHPTQRLEPDAVGSGNAHDPRRKQFIRQWMWVCRPYLAGMHGS